MHLARPPLFIACISLRPPPLTRTSSVLVPTGSGDTHLACTLEDRCENQTKRKSARAIPLGDFGTIRSRPRRPELVPLSVSTRWSWAARPRQAPPPKVPRRVPRPKQPAHRTETRFGETRTPSRPLLLRLHLETMMAHHSRWQNLIRKKTSIKLPLLNALLLSWRCAFITSTP